MSGWRPLLRVARRDALRHKGRSLLIALLVAVPVAAMSASLTIGHSAARTPDQDASATMGQADLSLRSPDGFPAADWQAALPAGARWTPVRAHDRSAAIVKSDELFEPSLFEASLSDPLLAGMAEVVEGREARAPDEVVLSTALAGALGATVGDRLAMARPDRMVTVVGTGVTPGFLGDLLVFVPPGWWDAGGAVVSDSGGPLWLIEVDDADPASVRAALEARFPLEQYLPGVTYSTPEGVALPAEPSLSVSTRDQVLAHGAPPDDQVSGTFVAGVLALVWTGAVAAAAFAVGARRRLREVGLLAATGGAPRHLRQLLLADGVVLGLAGALAGVAGGVLIAALARPHLDRLVSHAVDGLKIPVLSLIGAAVVGCAAAVLAALVPAGAASRVPLLSALAGLRPRRARARSWLAWGLVALGAGVILCWRGGRSGSETSVNAGVLLVVFGVAATTGPLLGLISRAAGAVPLSLRLAARDAGRSRGRAGPATVAAMLALAGAVGGSAMFANGEAQAEREYVPYLRDDQVSLSFTGSPEDGLTPGEVDAVVDAATDALPGAVGGPMSRIHLSGDPQSSIVAGQPERVSSADDDPSFISAPGVDVAVGDAATLEALGAVEARDALEAGRLVAINGGTVDAGGTVTLWSQAAGEVSELATLPAVKVAGEPLLGASRYLISPATAETLGLVTRPYGAMVRSPRPVTDADVRRVNLAVLDAVPAVALYTSREMGQNEAGRAVLPAMLGAGALVALFVLGLVSALSREELRPHLATLAAVGAAPRSRRRFAAAQSGLLAGTAAVLAVPAGLIPAVTLLGARSSASLVVVPWPAIAALVVGVTLLGTFGGGLLTRTRGLPAT